MHLTTLNRLAAISLIMLFLSNDLLASGFAIRDFRTDTIPVHHWTYQASPAQSAAGPVAEADVRLATTMVRPPAALKTYLAREELAYIGAQQQDPLSRPEDDIFTINVAELPDAAWRHAYLQCRIISSADQSVLSYNLNGSVDFIFESQARQMVVNLPLEAALINQGENTIRFSTSRHFNFEISELKIAYSKSEIPFHAVGRLEEKLVKDPELCVLVGAKPDCQAQLWASRPLQTPSIPYNITNVTKGAHAYKLSNAEHCDNSILGLAIERGLIPSHYSLNELRVFYFDDHERRWKAIMNDSLSENGDLKFVPNQGATQYFAGLIKTPEMPEAAAFQPTQIKDIKAADPTAEMQLMSPPKISRSGEASLNYPLPITPGRNGFSPDLNLIYNSDKASGWIGTGWDIALPKISIDTRWGVPRFDTSYESELYNLNGQSLLMEGGCKANRPLLSGEKVSLCQRPAKSRVRFFERRMPAYKTIERVGNSPRDYFWIVTLADNTRLYYGHSNNKYVSPNAVLTDADGNIVEWYLCRKIDKWGNEIQYSYQHETINDLSNAFLHGAKSVYPKAIYYTGYKSVKGLYSIHFLLNADSRIDAGVDVRYGFKKADHRQLAKVELRFDNDSYRYFKFSYKEGDFFKVLLSKITEYRNGEEFHSHQMDYYSEDLDYSSHSLALFRPIEVQSDMTTIVPEVQMLDFANTIVPSLISSGLSYGLSLNAYVGAGVVIVNTQSDKMGTMGMSFGHSWDYYKGINALSDMNGDGIPDLLLRRDGTVKYIPMLWDAASENLTLGNEKTISHTPHFLKTFSSSASSGFQLNLGVEVVNAFFGNNKVSTRSETNYYPVDYNGDGLTDIVQNGTVTFNHLSSNGNITLLSSSENTPNPVIKGRAIEPVEDDWQSELIDQEVVRCWTAPFSGIVDVSGSASVSSLSDDGVKVALQHNDQFVHGFSNIASGGTLPMEAVGLTVLKGDRLLFRAHAANNGFNDYLHWDPQVSYQQQHYKDPNGVLYSRSKASEGFMLSAPTEFRVYESGNLEIDFNSISGYGRLSDELWFEVWITEYDDQGDSVACEVHQAHYNANSWNNFDKTALKLKGSSNQSSFIYPGSHTLDCSNQEQYGLRFFVRSTSNLHWKKLDWRPVIKWTPASTQQELEIYPVVCYRIFNQLHSMAGAHNVADYSDRKYLQLHPIIPATFFNAYQGGDASAVMLLKTHQRFLAKLKLDFSSLGYTVRDYSSGTVLPTGTAHYNQAFEGADLYRDSVFVEFYTDNEELASLLAIHTTAKLYEFIAVNGNYANNFLTNLNGVSVYQSRRLDESGVNYLGWGQFGWAAGAGAIAMEDIKFPQPPENVLQYDENEDNLDDLEAELAANGLDPAEMAFYGLIPRRGESYNYPAGSGISLSMAAKRDHWSSFLQDKGVFAEYQLPAFFGEFEREAEPLLPPVNSLYTASAPVKKSKSTSKSNSGGAGLELPTANLGISLTQSVDDLERFSSRSLSEFMDVNGDRYPDVLGRDTDGIQVQLSNSSGGIEELKIFRHVALNNDFNSAIILSNPQRFGIVPSGGFANENGRYSPVLPSVLNQNHSSSNEGEIVIMDMNGDGLPDKLINGVAGVTLQLGAGRKFEPPLISSIPLISVENGASEMQTGGNFINKANGSFKAGLQASIQKQASEKGWRDVNGDNLPDLLIKGALGSYDLWLNTGTDFRQYNSGLMALADFAANSSLAAALHGTATLAIVITILPGVNLKIAITGGGSGNLALNNVTASLQDINGDGLADFLEQSGSGLQLKLSRASKSNLLKRVSNPLQGSFTLSYERKGNRYGNYERLPETYSHAYAPPSQEGLIFWDMPQSKWVLASVETDDGLDIIAGSLDRDGVDQFTTRFYYDGGIYSRREREFKGFARIATRSPELIPDPSQAEVTGYTTQIQQFIAPTSSDFNHRVEYEYFDGLLESSYKVIHCVKTDIDPFEEFDQQAEMSVNNYSFFPVNIDGAQANSDFNTIELSKQYTAADRSEKICLFPALTSTETHVFLKENDLRHYSYKYEFDYDKYGNPIRVIDNGRSEPATATWVQIGEYRDGENLKKVNGLQLSPNYQVDIIALMHYYDPANASGQTGLMRKHRIFVGDTSSFASLQRMTTVDALDNNNRAPAQISTHLNENYSGTTDISYNSNGTVASVTGPANYRNQRMQLNFEYDSQLSQYVTKVSNSYGDYSCMGYVPKTGQPAYVIDINGFSTVYSYDDFDRLQKVFAPRQINDPDAPYTIQFNYFPQGIDPSASLYTKKVPVAITNHFVKDSYEPDQFSQAPESGTCEIPDLGIHVSEANSEDLLRTATFSDGLGRVVQVKQEVSKADANNEANIKARLVSGVDYLDGQGRVIAQTIPVSEAEGGNYLLGELNSSVASGYATVTWYDYFGRIDSTLQNTASGDKYFQNYDYRWDWLIDQNYFVQTSYDGFSGQKQYFDSKNQVVATVQKDPAQLWTADPQNDILTRFHFDELGQLSGSEDALNAVTAYQYDRLGRMTEESHPDRGVTTMNYDFAGNLLSTNHAGGNINYAYHYTRLTNVFYPENTAINNVEYSYGALGDGRNGAGRIVRFEQGDGVLDVNYKYDNLGQLMLESKKIAIPLSGERSFNTHYVYDSWGRLRSMRYPDDETVKYYYGPGGELERVVSDFLLGESEPYSYVEQILYDGFGNQSRMVHGNGVVTDMTHSPHNFALTRVELTSPATGVSLLDKSISYRKDGNITGVSNSSGSYGELFNQLGGDYSHTYQYDYAGRLTSASGSHSQDIVDGSGSIANTIERDYQLNLSYNLVGGITTKYQSGDNDFNYQLDYNYGAQPHQIETLQEGNLSKSFSYNGRGSITAVGVGEDVERRYFWDEADRLRATQNAQGLHHNIYDPEGMRLMKGSVTPASVGQNGQSAGSGYQLSPYLVYVNPYFVCRYYNDEVEVSKHYFAGSQRVSSKLYNKPLLSEVPEDPNNEPELAGDGLEYPNTYNGLVQNNIVLADLQQIISLSGEEINIEDFIEQGLPNYYYLPDLPEYTPCLDEETKSGGEVPLTMTSEQTVLGYYDCICKHNPELAASMDLDCRIYSELYWYHPDYLGNTEFITDLGGYPYQHFWYTPFGESLVSQSGYSGQYSSPYRFNGKELDGETGLYYYGARYYESQWSIWLSVDPLASKFPNLSPYNFVENNPIMMIDPDGRGPWIYDQQEDGSYQRREGVENDGGENFHTYNNNDGTTSYYDQQAGTFVTVDNAEVAQKVTDLKNEPPTRLGALGIGVNFEYAIPGSLTLDGEPGGNGFSFDLMADAGNNLQLLKTAKTPDGSMKNQFGLSIGLQFSFTTETGDNPNPLNGSLIGSGTEWGAASGPFGYSNTTDQKGTYQMHTAPIIGWGIDFGLTKWKTNTSSVLKLW